LKLVSGKKKNFEHKQGYSMLFCTQPFTSEQLKKPPNAYHFLSHNKHWHFFPL